MSRSLFGYLTWANPKNIANSPEEAFYDQNASLFHVALSQYNDNTSLYGIIRANIVLQGLKTKKELDHNIELFSKAMLSDAEVVRPFFLNAPHFLFEGQNIYIPTYSPNINARYEKKPESFKDSSYAALIIDGTCSLIDPFETYSYALYDSMFTRLVRLQSHECDSSAFYHPEFRTLFVINLDGSLQQEIPLFDEKLRNPNDYDLFGRLEALMEAYYSNDRDRFLSDLVRLELISKSLYEEILHEVEMRDREREKRLRR